MLTLDEEDIRWIKRFLEDAETIDTIDGVYIIAAIQPKDNSNENKEIIQVIAINNMSQSYLNILLEQGIQLRPCDMEDIKVKLYDMNLFYFTEPGSRLSFHIDDSEGYDLSLDTREKKLNEMYLVSSTILLDKYGNLASHKEEASKIVRPSQYTVAIENINEVLKNDQKSMK